MRRCQAKKRAQLSDSSVRHARDGENWGDPAACDRTHCLHDCDLVLQRLISDLGLLGYRRMIVKTDQEPAIVDLVKVLKDRFAGEIILESSPVGDSQGNGGAESGVKSIEGMIVGVK